MHFDGVERRQMQLLHVTGLPLHERADHGAVVRANDKVAFLKLLLRPDPVVGVAFRSPSDSGYGSVIALPPTSRAFYDRERTEGKSHKQALIALARRRINVIWAMLRDNTVYIEHTNTPTAA